MNLYDSLMIHSSEERNKFTGSLTATGPWFFLHASAWNWAKVTHRTTVPWLRTLPEGRDFCSHRSFDASSDTGGELSLAI